MIVSDSRKTCLRSNTTHVMVVSSHSDIASLSPGLAPAETHVMDNGKNEISLRNT